MTDPEIWIVEDDIDDTDFLREAFRPFSSHIIIRYFSNGNAVLNSLHEHRNPTPLLLLIDWQMPFMSGWELIQRLRRDHPHVPLKMKLLSGGFTSQEQAFALQQGISLHEKPVSVSGWQNFATYVVTDLTQSRHYYAHASEQSSTTPPASPRSFQ